MNNEKFKFEVLEKDGVRVINFANKTDEFVEVVFTINDKEIKCGQVFSNETRGYAYPPKLEKEVKKMKDGSPLPFPWLKTSEVKAYIFRGIGKYYDRDLDKPTFLRHRLVRSIKFDRTDKVPSEVLAV